MLYKTFDWVMTKLGRKYVFVDTLGAILGYRYYFFYVETNQPTTWKEKYLPNLFVHHGHREVLEEDKLHGDVTHTHPWSTLSIVIKGQYVEEINHNVIKTLKAPAIIWRPWNVSHRILSAKADTWSLFFHGIRHKKGSWSWDLRPHEKICSWCETNNKGVCYNIDKGDFMQWGDNREIKHTSLASKGWRETSWIKYDSDFDKLIEERRKAVARVNTKNKPAAGFHVVKNTIEESSLQK